MTKQPPLTAKEAAAALRVCIDTFYDIVKRGDLSYIRRGKRIFVRPEAIEEFWSKQEITIDG